MRRITLQPRDFEVLRQTLPLLNFHPKGDAPPADPLLLRHLHDYRFARHCSPNVEFRVGAFQSGKTRICSYYWLPAKPQGTTFLVHGYFDHIGLYGHLIEYLLARGQAVVAFDLPGHGLSGGEPLSINHFSDYQQVLCDLISQCQYFPRPFNLVGQSTGAAVILGLLQTMAEKREDNPFHQVNLLAPLIRPWRWHFNCCLYWLLSPFVTTAKRKFRDNSTDPGFVNFLNHCEPLQARRIPLCWVKAMMQWVEDFSRAPTSHWRLTVIQGESDSTVDWRYNLNKIAQQFPHSRLQMIPKARHHLVNERSDVRGKVFECLQLD